MENKKAIIEGHVFYVTGIVLIILFFLILSMSIFFVSVSNSKQVFEDSLASLNNIYFIVGVLLVAVVFLIVLLIYLFRKLKQK